MTKVSTFAELRANLARIPDIHRGGCGISALAMYKWLKENKKLSKNFKFYFFYTWMNDGDYKHNNRVLRNETDSQLQVPSHIGIYHRGRIIDCTPHVREYTLSHPVELEHLDAVVKMINEPYEWNPSFNRSVYLPVIESFLGQKLKIRKGRR